MSSVGYPDYQRITQWLGAPQVQGTGLVIGAGTHVDGPIEVANFASVIVALKASVGNVTVTLKQTVPGGPAGLVLSESVLVPAGATLFEVFVLFGQAVELDLTGSIAGTSVDYALYGSNTTTNAQVITSATINLQHNAALVAAEPTLDFEDTTQLVWTPTDDAVNTRVKLVAVPLVPVFATAAALNAAIPAPLNGQRVRIKPATAGGADVIHLTYDTVLGHWIGDPIKAPAMFANFVTNSAAGFVMSGPELVPAFYDMVNAGFSIQARIFGAGSVGGGGLWRVELAAFQGHSGGTAFGFQSTLASSTGSSAGEGYIDSGWTGLIAPAFTDTEGGLAIVERGDGVNNMTGYLSSAGWIRFVL